MLSHHILMALLLGCYIPEQLCIVYDYSSHSCFCSAGGRLIFDTMNLNTQASWYTDDKPEGRDANVLCLQQLERDTFFIGIDRIFLTVCIVKFHFQIRCTLHILHMT